MITGAAELTAYLETYPVELALGDEDPTALVDRWHTADIAWTSDGVRFDRESLVAHATPTRRNVESCRVDVHDAIVCGDRVAARYDLRGTLRKGATLALAIALTGRLAEDGRLCRIDQLTRPLEPAGA